MEGVGDVKIFHCKGTETAFDEDKAIAIRGNGGWKAKGLIEGLGPVMDISSKT